MSHYSGPEALAANPPESWRVVKRDERLWHLLIDSSHEYPAETFTTRRAALAERDDPNSRLRREVERERRWMAGEPISGWKTYAECLADRQRNEAYQAKRRAERAA
jgi:hypothetical protein